MYTLTERRLNKLLPLLDTCLESLAKRGRFETGWFEAEVRKTLSTGYREVKDLAEQLAATEEYERVGAYFMEFGHGIGPASEHKSALAKLYGVKDYDHSPDTAEKRDAYWGATPSDG